MTGAGESEATTARTGRGPLGFPWLVLAVFLFVYNISFLAAPSLTTGRVTLLVLLLCYRRQLPALGPAVGPIQRAAGALALLVGLYAAAQYVLVSGGDTVQLSRIVNFTLYVLLGGALFACASGFDGVRFARAFGVAAGVQGLLAVISFFSPGYRGWLADLLVQGGNIPLTSPFQAPGFSNSSGATLSLVQALGMFAALFAARYGVTRARWLLYGAAVLAGGSTIIVGRTGLQLALGLAIFFGVFTRPALALRNVVVAGVLLGAIVLWREWLLARLSVVAPQVASTLSWAFELFASGAQSTFFRDFGGQAIPPFGPESLVGTGRVMAERGGGNASGHDSGYIQTGYALGIPMALVFYGSVLSAVGEAWARARFGREPLLLLLLAMFVAEVKEPFMFKYSFPFTAFVLLWLAAMPGPQPMTVPGGAR